MGNRNQYGWNHQQSNANQVGSLFEAVGMASLGLVAPNLKCKRPADCAWQIAGSNALIGLEAESLKVLAGVAAVAMSAGSRGRPGRNLAKFSGEVEGETGVDLLDGPVTDFVAQQRIDNDDSIASELNFWDHVVTKHNSQQQGDDCQTGKASLLGGVEQRLDGGKARQHQGAYGNDIARGGSFHPEIVARKEQFNGNL